MPLYATTYLELLDFIARREVGYDDGVIHNIMTWFFRHLMYIYGREIFHSSVILKVFAKND